jgi:hypothetical protein
MFCSTNALISASTSESTGSDFSAAAEEVEAFITASPVRGLSHPLSEQYFQSG